MRRSRADWEAESTIDWHYMAHLRDRSEHARSLPGALLLSAVLVLIGLIVMQYGERADLRLAFAAYTNLVVVVGLQIFMGNSNIANLSHSGFMGLGAYLTAVLATPVATKALLIPHAPFGLSLVQLPVAAAVLGVVLTVGVIAFLIGLVIARLSGIAATILTLSVIVIINSTLVQWTDLFRGNQAFYGIPQEANLQWAIATAVGVVILARFFRDSRAGVQLRASAMNKLAAEAMGVNVFRLRLVAWTLGAVVASMGGVLFAFYVGTINARSFYFNHVFLTLAMLVLGGMRTVSGAVVGVTILTVSIEIIRQLEAGPVILGAKLPEMLGLSGIALGVILVLCMILRPDGIMGYEELDETLGRWWSRFKAWRAGRSDARRPPRWMIEAGLAAPAPRRRRAASPPQASSSPAKSSGPKLPAAEPRLSAPAASARPQPGSGVAPSVPLPAAAAAESMFDIVLPAKKAG